MDSAAKVDIQALKTNDFFVNKKNSDSVNSNSSTAQRKQNYCHISIASFTRPTLKSIAFGYGLWVKCWGELQFVYSQRQWNYLKVVSLCVQYGCVFVVVRYACMIYWWMSCRCCIAPYRRLHDSIAFSKVWTNILIHILIVSKKNSQAIVWTIDVEKHVLRRVNDFQVSQI